MSGKRAAHRAAQAAEAIAGAHAARLGRTNAQQAVEELCEPVADAGERIEGHAAARHLLDEQKAGNGKEHVRSPHTGECRDLLLSGDRDADLREEAVEKDEQNSVTANPVPLPPRLDERPSGTPTSISTRHAAGNEDAGETRWNRAACRGCCPSCARAARLRPCRAPASACRDG